MQWIVTPVEDALCVREFLRRKLPLSSKML